MDVDASNCIRIKNLSNSFYIILFLSRNIAMHPLDGPGKLLQDVSAGSLS
jgi:hypothetical protein